jgi:hypothetical protein
VRFAFRTYAIAHNNNFELIVNDNGWDNFRKALLIRHRLMHPKDIGALLVSDEEMRIVARASVWVGRNIVSLLRNYNPLSEAKILSLEKQLNELEQLQNSVV